jgi:hypothetical protein
LHLLRSRLHRRALLGSVMDIESTPLPALRGGFESASLATVHFFLETLSRQRERK